jgi:hypothetical protein
MTYILPVVMGLLLLPIWIFKVIATFWGLVQIMSDSDRRQRSEKRPVSSK